MAVSFALGLAQASAVAQVGAVIELSDLNGQNGFVINGISPGDRSGMSVSTAGDVNGDGIDDVIVGAFTADINGQYDAGSSYVVFGSDTDFSEVLSLSDLNGSNGFVINGVNAGDESGRSVSAAGDVNGDGIGDIIIGARHSSPDDELDAGSSYVVFGTDIGFPNPLNLTDLNGQNGFVINGVNAGDRSGSSVSAAGDVNGDGIDDVVVGALLAEPNGLSNAGSSYVVFGNESAFSNLLGLSDLNGQNGFVINGENTDDQSGISVTGAGDINGDGIDDVMVGARNGGAGTGRAYVVFGNDGGLSNPLNLSDLNGQNGFVINGENTDDQSGISVTGAGDINGDGIDDVMVGARNGGAGTGRAYVVFGNDGGLSNPLNLSDLNGQNGFVINGESTGHQFGFSVGAAGDVNGDGIDDIIMGAYRAESIVGTDVGRTYVVFGRERGFPGVLSLSGLDGLNGLVINGVSTGDRSGSSVSTAGDVNGDGIDDVIVGAFAANPGGVSIAGSSYVIFGSDVVFKNGFESL